MKFNAVALISVIALPLVVAGTPVSHTPSSRTIVGRDSILAASSGEINGVEYELSPESIKVAGRFYSTAQPTVVHGAGHTLNIGTNGAIQIDGTPVPAQHMAPTRTPDALPMYSGDKQYDDNSQYGDNSHYGENHDGDTQFGDNHDGDTQFGDKHDSNTQFRNNHDGDTQFGDNHDGDTQFGDNHDGNNHFGDNHFSLNVGDNVQGDKVVGSNVVHDNENSVGVINTGNYNRILSTNVVSSFNNNTINYYKNNSKFYYAKLCADCNIVKVKDSCNCYITQNCPTCSVLTQHVTYHRTMHMTKAMTGAAGTDTVTRTVTQMGSVSYQCPTGECSKPTASAMAAAMQGTVVPLSTGVMPTGAMPAGAMPAGATPTGAMPAGAMPTGAMPAGVMPTGAMPAGAMPTGAMPAGAIPASAMPAGAPTVLPIAPFQNSTMPTGQAGAAPGTTVTLQPTTTVANAPTSAPSAGGQGPTPSSLPPFMGSAMTSKAPLFFAAAVAIFGSVLML